ncbi:MAG: TetR/AcrR family transcriptional regulator [Alphaproteobacteria bacterium]
MARRSDHTREELKELILETSWDIVGLDGFENLSARRIAGEIGYTPGTIYNLFDSMDDLYLQVNARTLTQLRMLLDDPACNHLDKAPVQNMKEMASLYIRFTQNNRKHWLMLFQHTTPDDFELPEWFDGKIEEMFAPLERQMRGYFSAEHQVRQKMAARMLWSSVHGLCFLQETGKIGIVRQDMSMERIAHSLIDIFIKGIEKS